MQGDEDDWLTRHVSVRGLVMTVVTAVVAGIVVLTLMHRPGGPPAYTPAVTEPTETTSAPPVVEASSIVDAPPSDAPPIDAQPVDAPSTIEDPPPSTAESLINDTPEATEDIPSTTDVTTSEAPTTIDDSTTSAAAPSTSETPTASDTPTASTTPTTTRRKYVQPPAPTTWASNQVHR